MKRSYGLLPDKLDARDFYAMAPRAVLPDWIDMRGKLPAIKDQKSLGSCHDDQTEVLTQEGWKLFKDVDAKDKLASVDPITNELIFEIPTRLIELPYEGDLIIGKHLRLDFAVTPDHKMLVRKWDEAARTLSSEYSFVEAKDIGWYAGFLTKANSVGNIKDAEFYTLPPVVHAHETKGRPYKDERKIEMHAWLKLIGIYLADGCMLRDANHYGIQIAGTKDRKKDFIKNLAIDLGLNLTELSDRVKFFNKQIWTEFESMGFYGIKAPEKFVPKFIFDLPAEYIRSFLEGHFEGDGSKQESAWGVSKAHYTSSKRLAEDLHRLIFLSGSSTRIGSRAPRNSVIKGREIVSKNTEYRISVCDKGGISVDKKRSIFKQHYSGMVYCAEVPSYHTLVTRRNGHILISGNCTAFGTCAAYNYKQITQKQSHGKLSELYTYYNTRVIQNTVDYDSGASIRDAVKSVATNGVCHQTSWPYDIAKFRQRPNQKSYDEGNKSRAVAYLRVDQNLTAMKSQLAAGNPIIFGFSVFESFESQAVANSGIVPIPNVSREKLLGGHCMTIVGYSSARQTFIVRNSWGKDWGMKGYCEMPFAFLLDSSIASDFWIFESVPTPGLTVGRMKANKKKQNDRGAI